MVKATKTARMTRATISHPEYRLRRCATCSGTGQALLFGGVKGVCPVCNGEKWLELVQIPATRTPISQVTLDGKVTANDESAAAKLTA